MELRKVSIHNKLISLLLSGEEFAISTLADSIMVFFSDSSNRASRYKRAYDIMSEWEAKGYISVIEVEPRLPGGPQKLIKITEWGEPIFRSVLDASNRLERAQITREERKDLFERFVSIIQENMKSNIEKKLMDELRELMLDKLFEIFLPYIIIPTKDFSLKG